MSELVREVDEAFEGLVAKGLIKVDPIVGVTITPRGRAYLAAHKNRPRDPLEDDEEVRRVIAARLSGNLN